MKEQEIIFRWHKDNIYIVLKAKLDEFFSRSNQMHLKEIPEICKTNEGYYDLRGYKYHSLSVTKGVCIEDADLSFCDLSSNFIRNCSFTNVKFENSKLNQISEGGCRFINCKFIRTEFRGASLGYDGSKYISCEFQRADFTSTLFIRGEYDKCKFVNCKIRGRAFLASSFEDCEFEGKLINVEFSNGYLFDSYYNDYGIPRKNSMKNVSFRNADLLGVYFRGGVDLSSITMPVKEGNILVSDFRNKLLSMENNLNKYPESCKNGLSKMIELYKDYNIKQDWMIFNIDDLIKYYGKETTNYIIQIMR